MAFINIAQPNNEPVMVNVVIADEHVVLWIKGHPIIMNHYDALELGRMITSAAQKL